jgi:acetolactate synthase I/II/III large subunit
MSRLKGADLIVEYFRREKMPFIFGICGHGNVGLLDALYDARADIRFVSPRHEQAAGHMADAYFRVAHRPVATLTSTGPGSANLVGALACALSDSSAFLAITANVPTSQENRAPFQELYHHHQADFPSALRPVVKRSFHPSRVDMLPLALRQSMAALTAGRPGPVNLDIPYNLFQEADEVEVPESAARMAVQRPGASPQELQECVRLLSQARRPVLFVGHGVTLAEAGHELTELVLRTGVPVISSPNGMGCLDMRHPLALGFIGRNGAYPANQAGRHADLVIAIGARFDDRSSSSWIPGYSWNFPSTKLVHVDIDPAELGRNYPVTLGIVADARTFLQQVLKEAPARNEAPPRALVEWHGQIAKWKQEWERFIHPNFQLQTSPLRPEGVVRDIRAVLPDEAIVCLDSGVHHNWFMQFWSARRPQTMLNAWGYSSMGFGVCGVLGAKLAAPERPCVAIVGDGGFMMAPHVLATAVEYDIACVWVIWNNFAWAAIRDLQYGLYGGREIGTAFYRGQTKERYNPDFAALARACGVEGLTVTRQQEFANALEHAVKLGRPCLLDVHVDAEIRPPATGTWQLPPTPYKEPSFGKPFVPGEPG